MSGLNRRLDRLERSKVELPSSGIEQQFLLPGEWVTITQELAPKDSPLSQLAQEMNIWLNGMTQRGEDIPVESWMPGRSQRKRQYEWMLRKMRQVDLLREKLFQRMLEQLREFLSQPQFPAQVPAQVPDHPS